MTTHTVRAAAPADRAALAHALARSFSTDPVFVWGIPDDAVRVERSRLMFREFLRGTIGEGLVDTTDALAGAAIWAPPGHRRPGLVERILTGIAAVRAFRGMAAPMGQGFETLARMHPKAPHWYLSILGADPDHQGTGVGSALLKPRLAHCDREGLLAYLETATENNVRFYERRGFEVTGEFTLPKDGPKLWLMERPPA